MGIKEHIRQGKPFRSEFHKAHINVLFTASWFGQQSAQVLKPLNISWQQFNILRILRGLHPEPATISTLKERMIDKASNASRLVDKLKRKGMVSREYCEQDRRRVHIRLTPQGEELLQKASYKMEEELTGCMEHISLEEAAELNRILDKITS
jgi:DNA-binding MarR family transcriptional regulator